jgi:hypothetical protein
VSVDPREQRALYDARRHLGDIGVQTQFTARGDALKGEMAFPGEQALRNPDGGPGIERIRFTVLGDGSMRIDDPPQLGDLTGLPPARQLRSVEAMSAAIRQAMDRRFAGLRQQGAKLRDFGFKLQTDPERMVLVARVDLERLGVVLIESSGTGFVARELLCEGGKSFPFPETPLDLARFDERIDLELFLAGEAERLVPDQGRRTIVSGHHAVHDETELFGELADGVSDIVAGLTPPAVGEVWVMDVIVEADDGEEVRYRGVGFTGQAFGAPRVLPKLAFEAAYVRSGRTHRMLVQVTHVDAQNVGYVKLDSERRPEGGDRKVALVGFLANFTQEPSLG